MTARTTSLRAPQAAASGAARWLSLGVLLAILMLSSAFAAEKPLEIYLLIGQSNMAGRAEITPEIADPLEGVFLLNAEGAWEPAQNPLNRYSTIRKSIKMQRLGPGYGFAREMRAQRPDARIGLVVNARGGSNIDKWAEGTEFFNEAVARTQLALQAGGELKGILWHQGESDAEDTAYLEKAAALIAALRAALGNEQLPFVVGETCAAEETRPVNALLKQIPSTVPRTACVSSQGLTAYDGNTHFDTASQLELGQRYATELLRLLGPAPQH